MALGYQYYNVFQIVIYTAKEYTDIDTTHTDTQTHTHTHTHVHITHTNFETTVSTERRSTVSSFN